MDTRKTQHEPQATDAGTPLKRIEFMILAVLKDGPLHGYGIVKEIERISAGAIRTRAGSLYRVLDRLMRRGLLTPASASVPQPPDDRRTNYLITDEGRAVVQAEAALMAEVAAHVAAASPVASPVAAPAAAPAAAPKGAR